MCGERYEEDVSKCSHDGDYMVCEEEAFQKESKCVRDGACKNASKEECQKHYNKCDKQR